MRRLVQVLLDLLRIFAAVNRLGCRAGPDKLLGSRVIDTEDEGSDVYGRVGCCTNVRPREAEAPAVGVPLPFLRDTDLVRRSALSLAITAISPSMKGGRMPVRPRVPCHGSNWSNKAMRFSR